MKKEMENFPEVCWIITDKSGVNILGESGPALGNLFVFSCRKRAEDTIGLKNIKEAVPKRMTKKYLFESLYKRFDFFVLDPAIS
jgi:hypothetical protein